MSVLTSENVLGHWVHCSIPAQLASAEIADTTAYEPCGSGRRGRSTRKYFGGERPVSSTKRSHFKEFGH